MFVFLHLLSFTFSLVSAYPLGEISLGEGHTQETRLLCEFHQMRFEVLDKKCFRCNANLTSGPLSDPIEVVVLAVQSIKDPLKGAYVASFFRKGRLFGANAYAVYPDKSVGFGEITIDVAKEIHTATSIVLASDSCAEIAEVCSSFKLNGPTYENPLTSEEGRPFQQHYGYTSALMGCAQFICLDANVDSANYAGNYTIYVYRGTKGWSILDKPDPVKLLPTLKALVPSAKRATSIQASWYAGREYMLAYRQCFFRHGSDLLPCNQSLTKHLTNTQSDNVVAAFFTDGNVHFFLEDANELNMLVVPFESSLGNQTTQNSQAGQESEEGEDSRKKRQNEGGNKTDDQGAEQTISGIGIPDAVYIKETTVHILKGWKYATVPLDKIEQPSALKWRYSFLEVFGCDTQIYKRKDVGQYIDVDDYIGYLQKSGAEKPNGNPMLIPLILMAVFAVIQVGVIIAAFVAWNKFKKETEQGLISMMKAYKKKGKKGNEDRLSRVMSTKLGSSIGSKTGPSSKTGEKARSRLSVLDSVGQSKVELGSGPSPKKKKKIK